MGGGWLLMVSAVIASVVYFLFMPMADGSIFHTEFHYICHFSIMVMGGLVYLNKEHITRTSALRDCILTVVWFAIYFIILYIGKGKTDYRYYIQILGLLPLHLFVFYIYKFASHQWCKGLFQKPGLKWILIIISNLTLEIYIVQFHIITDKFNMLFPLNTIIVFALICMTAYFLKVITSLFIQFISPEPFDFRKAIKIS